MSTSRGSADGVKKNLFAGKSRRLVDDSDSDSSDELQQTTRFGSADAVSSSSTSAPKRGASSKGSRPNSPTKATTEGTKGKSASKNENDSKKSKDGDKSTKSDGGSDEDSDGSKENEPKKPRKRMTKKQKIARKKAKEKRRKDKEKRRKEAAARNAKKKEGEPMEVVSSDSESSSEAETIDEWDTLIVRMGKPVVVSNDLAADVIIQPNQWKAEDLSSHQLMKASTVSDPLDSEGKTGDEETSTTLETIAERKQRMLQQANTATKVKRAAQAHMLDLVNQRGNVQDGIFIEQYPPMAPWARSTADSRWLREGVGEESLMPGPIPLKPKRIGVEILSRSTDIESDGRLHGVKGNMGMLTISLKKLRFRSHQTFCHEDYLATQLRLRFRDYRTRFGSPVLQDLAQKIKHFYVSFISSKSSQTKSKPPARRDKMAILRTLLSLAQESHEIRMLGKEVYTLWKEVKEERLRCGFQLTGVKVTAQRVALYDQRLVDRVFQAAEQFVTDYLDEAAALGENSDEIISARALRRRMDRAKALFAANMGAATSSKKKDKKSKKSKKDKKPGVAGGADDFLFTLVDDEESISGEISVPPEERQRRQAALSSKVGVHVFVNNKRVTRMGPAKLQWPTYTCDFSSVVPHAAKPSLRKDGMAVQGSTKAATVNLKLRRQPALVEMEVWEYTAASKPKQCIGRFILNLPGVHKGHSGTTQHGSTGDFPQMSSHSVPEMLTAYQFTSEQPFMTGLTPQQAAGPAEQKEEGADDGAEQKSKISWTTQKYVQGEITVETKWHVPKRKSTKHGSEELQSFLPHPVLAQSSRYIAHELFLDSGRGTGSDLLSVPEFARERDFCRAVLEGPAPPLNPNDPRNSDLIRLENLSIANAQLDFFNVKEFPRHLRLPKPKGATDEEDTQLSQRQQLLILRKQKGPSHLVNTHPIPASDLGVTTQTGLLAALDEEQSRKDDMKGDQDEREAIAYGSTEDVEKRNKLVRSFFDKVRNRVQKLEYVNAVGQTDDMVHEEMLPSFFAPRPGTFSLADMLAPKRRLKPKRQERVTDNINVSSCSVFVQIASAKNIPIRSSAAAVLRERNRRGSAVGAQIGEFDVEERVSPYVTVTFQKKTNETEPQEGPNPRWGQSFSFDVDGPVDTEFSVDLLRQLNDEVHIEVFDHIEKDAELDNRLTSVEAVRLERRYLGCFDLPFSTILANKRIEGVFELDVPTPLVGYEMEPPPQRSTEEEEDEAEMQARVDARDDASSTTARDQRERRRKLAAMDAKRTQIRLMIALDPPIAQPIRQIDEPTAISASSSMQKRYVYFAKSLTYKLAEAHPDIKQLHRNISLTAITVTGEEAVICQFITPQKPPDFSYATISTTTSEDGVVQLSEFPNESRRALAHFVSLVPFIEDCMIFDGKMDVWTSSSDLLYLRAGDWEEHAILLCNYFLYLDSQTSSSSETYCCLGRAVPDGDVVFVLQRDDANEPFTVWNPRNGQSYPIDARYSPLVSVSVIFSNTNAWINIGPPKDIAEQSFDLSDAKLWHALQPTGTSVAAAEGEAEEEEEEEDADALHVAKLPSLQSGSPQYNATDLTKKLAIDLQTAIQQKVEVCMRNWRKATSRTIFNLDFSKRLGSLLERLEESKLAQTEADAQALLPTKDEIDALGGRSKDVYAVPLHISLVDIMQVEQLVKRTQIYTIDDPRVEFAVAAQPFMYPGGLTSVWIFLAAILPKGISSFR